jgi:hypothetical protein
MKAETSAALKVVALGCTIIFLVFLGISAPFYFRQRDVLKNWPRTEGKIIAADVVTLPGKPGTTYMARFLVQYRFEDSVVSSTVTSGYGDRFRSQAEKWLKQFPEGKTVTIAYNPLQPTDVRMNPGYNRFFFAVPLFITEMGLIFLGIAIVLYVIARSGRTVRDSKLPLKK